MFIFEGGEVVSHRNLLVYQNEIPVFPDILNGSSRHLLGDKGRIDWKEVRAFPKIGGDCFESVYLGVNLKADEKSEIIGIVKKLNQDIKIYQMTIDPNAFRLKEKLIFG